MRAVRLHAFGPPGNLRFEQVDDPVPGPGQVRIAVSAAGVHLIDTKIRSGTEGWFPLPVLPTIPGREVAGVVEALGADVGEAWLGRRVVAHLGRAGSGGYAELAVADAAALHPLPSHLQDPAAVAMIGTGRTAIAILEVAALVPGDVVVVTGAAGGIGSLLVQAGRNAGALVVGVAGGTAKVQQVRNLGAAVAVDHSAGDWTAAVRDALGGREASVVLDGVGGDLGRSAMDLLGVGGRLVLFGWSSGEHTRLDAADLHARSLTASAAVGARILNRPGGIRDLEEKALEAAARGRLVPLVQSFPLADAAGAHAAIESRATMGKTVLLPDRSALA